MALDDPIESGPDFTADSVLDRVARSVMPGLPQDGSMTGDMVLNRLNRKLSNTPSTRPAPIEPVAPPEQPKPKALDLSDQGTPIADLPDFSDMGTPIDAVPLPKPRPAAAPATIEPPKHNAFMRGLVSGSMEDNPANMAEALEAMSHLSPVMKDKLKSSSDYMRELSKLSPEDYKKRAGSMWDIKSFSEAMDWAGETLGSGLASSAPSLVMGGVGMAGGAAAGAAVGPVGAAAGARGGAMLGAAVPAMMQNGGEVYKALKDEKISPEEAAPWAAAAAVPMGLLDAVTPGSVIASLGGVKKVKEEVARAIAARIAHGIATNASKEGITEGLQEVVKQATLSMKADKPFWTVENAKDVVENAVGGAIVGGVMGAAEGAGSRNTKAAAPAPDAPAPTGPGQLTDQRPPIEGEGYEVRGLPGPDTPPPAPGMPGAAANPAPSSPQTGRKQDGGFDAFSILREYGYAAEDIEAMSDRQRRREAMDAVAEGIDPAKASAKWARPVDSSNAQTPSTADASRPERIEPKPALDGEIIPPGPANRAAPEQSAGQTIDAEPVGDRKSPIVATTAEDVQRAMPAPPTEAQAKAENYKHAHIELPQLGLAGKNSISVETGIGQDRTGTDADGKPWSVKMEDAAYGRIKGSKGADGEALDIFVGPNPTSEHVFVVDQHNPGGKGFDEHKIMAGFNTPQEALAAYGRAYNDGGGDRIGHVAAMGAAEFQAWLDGDTTKPLKGSTPAALEGPKGSTPVSDTGQNVPESRETLKAQQNQLIAGERAVQMFPTGTREMPLPPGMRRTETDRGVFHYNPKQIRGATVEAMSQEGKENELLGLGSIPKAEIMRREAAGEKPVTVVERNADGVEVRAAAGTEATAEGQRKEMEAGKGAGNTIGIEDTAATIEARKRATAPVKPARPLSMLQFIATNGGLRPDPELEAMDLTGAYRVQIPGRGGFFSVVKPGGMPLDRMREALQEAGYFPQEDAGRVSVNSVRDLLDAIDDELRGQRRYAEGYEGTTTAREDQSRDEESEHQYQRAIDGARDDLMSEYPGLPNDVLDVAAVAMVDDRLSAEDALEQTIMRFIDEDGAQLDVTPADLSEAYEGYDDNEIQEARARADGEDARPEVDQVGRSRQGEEAEGAGERAAPARAEEVKDAAPSAEVTADKDFESALDAIEEAIESGDRDAVKAAGAAARKRLIDTPQAVKDADSEYWEQQKTAIRRMMQPGYVTGRQQAMAETGKWWKDELTPAGRRQAVENAGLKPAVAKTNWQHIGPDDQYALMNVRSAPEGHALHVDTDAEPATAMPAGDSDETVDVKLTERGPWDFNDTWPKPIASVLTALDSEGRNPFDSTEPDVESVVGMLDEGMNGLMSAMAELRGIDERIADIRSGATKLRRGQTIDDAIKPLANDRRDFARELNDTTSSYRDIFGDDAARAMMKEARRRIVTEEGQTPVRPQRPAEQDHRDENGAPIAVGDRVSATNMGGKEFEATIRRFYEDPEGRTRAEIEGDPALVGKKMSSGISGHLLTEIAKVGPTPTTERTAAGEQSVIPGAEQIGQGEQAQRAADRGLKPKVAQKEAGGLFGDSMDQSDLMDALNSPPPAAPSAFQKWFGASKAADANGKPTVLYHGAPNFQHPGGTLGGFDVFDRLATTKIIKGRKPGMDNVGSWFSDMADEHGAEMYAGNEGSIYPVYLSIQNPYTPASFDAFLAKAHEAGNSPIRSQADARKAGVPFGRVDPEAMRGWLQQSGYDGVVFPRGSVDGSQHQVWIALEPTQIKSAIANAGTYDPTNPSIIDAIEKALGEDANRVAPVDIARAAEIMADNPGMPVETAFGQAVIENAVQQGFITEQEAVEAYGEQVKDVLEPGQEGASGRSGDVVEERAEPDEVRPGDAAQAGVVPSSGEARAKSPAQDEAGRDGAAAAPDAAEQSAADGNEGADGNAAVDAADAEVARKSEREAPTWAEVLHDLPLDKDGHKDVELAFRLMNEITGERSPAFRNLTPSQAIELRDRVNAIKGETDGVSSAVSSSDAGASAEAVQQDESGRNAGGLRERENAGSRADVRGADEGRAEGSGRVSEGAVRERGDGAGDGSADRLSEARDDDSASGRAERNAQSAANRVEGENYSIAPGALDEGRSFKVKAKDNIRAIELMRQIEAEGRPATRAEQAELAKYVGWGGIKNAFPDGNGKFGAGFEDIGARVRELMSDTEYETARRSIQYAHYTSEDIVRAMWDTVARMGFSEGSVFEPGMGVGNFAGMMPADIAANAHYVGLELDHTTARIAKLIYPKYGVRRDDFTKAPLPENNYDLVIGNPPFADVAIKSDPKYKQGFLLHDYFFAKSLDAVRPGGLLAFVTSAGTMNKIDTDAREYLADRADLVGAVRLPGNAFAKNAGTEVTTDIIILRKRRPDDVPGDRTWTETVQRELVGADGNMKLGNVNRYFAENPQMVLGEQGFFDKLYKDRYAVRAPKDFDLKTELRKALDTLPGDVMTPWQDSKADAAEQDFGTSEKKEGTFYVGPGGELHQVSEGIGRPVAQRGKGVEGGKSAADMDRIRGLIPVRDALRAVYAADLAGDTGNADRARAALNRNYDAFVAKFGPINKAVIQTRRPTVIQQESARQDAREEARYAERHFDEGSFDPTPYYDAKASLAAIAKARQAMRDEYAAAGKTFDEGEFDVSEIPDTIIDKRPNVDPFMDDPESYRLRAIEHYDDARHTAKKNPIFFENIITKERKPEIKSTADALLYSLSQFGRVNLPEMSRLAGKTEREVVDSLGESIFRVPGTNDAYQTRDEYLSGDVRKKLVQAKAAAEKNPEYRRNVTALEAAQPSPLAPSQIHATLGMPWIPPATISDFATKELGLDKLEAKYLPALAQWIVSGDTGSVAATVTWGTNNRAAPALISDALNRQNPKIYDEVYIDGAKRSVLNLDKTQAAQDKIKAIQERFADWIWKDTDRADTLAGMYNEKFNNLVVREYNGDYLTTPGIASSWSWRPHQKRGIARIIQSGNTYLAHAVGAGKTSEMIGAVMEKRRLGLARKPMIAVPNHMLAQFTKEFYEQYPTARLAVADERRFHTDRRKQFIANVASEDLDCVIITHSAFGMVPISQEFSNSIIEREIAQYRALLAEVKGERITRSRVEKQIERLEQRLEGKGKKRTDQVFTFEEMGIDDLSVDEAHLFRKLDFTTQMSSIKGISPEGSGMAWDLYVKAQYLDTLRPGYGLTLASGTPVTNTMAELYTVSRYLQPQVLVERGLEKFDAWAGAFGENVSELEQDAAGNYKPVSRFAKFVNVAELSAMVRQVMDVVTSRQLEQYVTRPQLKGGKRVMNLAEKSPELEWFQQQLASRMQAIQNRRGPPKKGDDIMLSVINDGRHAAIDMRLAGEKSPSSTPSKLDMMIEKMARIHKESSRQKFYKPKAGGGGYETTPAFIGPATQMAFINLGLSGARGFSVPDYIRSELVKRGVPKNEIAYIYDYKTSVAKQRLFNDMNEGKIRILLGSTAKMATGVNAQRRLLAIHNMDPLWYPSDDEQRNGRGIRQGNMNPEIEINDYSTKGTYDSTMWGMMEKKARFIQGFFEGDPSLRDMEDLGEASQYEQAKALTTNDPRLIKLTELRQDLERAQRRKAAFDNEAYATRMRRATAQSESEHYGTRVAETKRDIAQRVDTRGEAFAATVGKSKFDKRADFGEALYKRVDELIAKGPTKEGVKVADIGGFPLYADIRKGMASREANVADLYLSMNGGREREVRFGESSLGTIRSIESALAGLDGDLAEYESRKAKADRFFAESKDKANAKYAGDDEIARLTGEVRTMEAALASTEAPAPVEERGLSAVADQGLNRADLSKAALDQLPAIEALLTDVVKAIAPMNVEFARGSEKRSDLAGYGKPGELEVVGTYYPSRALIRLALVGTPDEAVKTALHEAYHAVEDRMQSDTEIALMKAETKRLRLYVKSKRVRGLTPSEIDKLAGYEIRAMAFEEYAHEKVTKGAQTGAGMHIGVRRVFEKLWRALRQLANGLRGLGFQTYEDVFEKTRTGGFSDASAARDTSQIDADEFAAVRHTRNGPVARETVAELLEDRNMYRLASLSRTLKVGDINAVGARAYWQDKFIRVRQAERSVDGEVPSGQSAYQAESLYYGRAGERLETLEKESFDPLIKDMKDRGVTLEEVNDYLYAKHAPERNARMDEINHPELMAGGRDLRGKGSGMSDAEAAEIMDKITAAGKMADYEAIEKRVRKIINDTREGMVESGLISQENADAWAKQYEHYVPLRDFAEGTEDENHLPGRGKGYDIRGAETKQAFGRLSRAAGPLPYIMQQAEMAIVRGEKNRVGNAWLRFVRANPDPRRWTVDRPPTRKSIDKATGLVTEVEDRSWMGRDDVFVTKVGGRPTLIQMHGADGANLARALKNMGSENLGQFLRFMRAVTTTMSRLATQWNPNFIIPNLVRDLGEAYINMQAQQQKGFISAFNRHLPKAFGGAFRAMSGKGDQNDAYTKAFKEFDAAGGRIRFFGLDSAVDIGATVDRKLRKLDGSTISNVREAGAKVADAFEWVNGSIENTTRLAAYMAARDVGMSQSDAAMLARNLTVDFNKKGEISGAMNALYMFSNVAFQGTRRSVNALNNKHVRRAAYALIGMGVASALLGYSGDDDEAGENRYSRVPAWDRDKNFIFMLPGGGYIKIPLPFGFAMFKSLGDRMTGLALGKESATSTLTHILKSVGDSFSPLGEESSGLMSLVPSALRPGGHIIANTNWNGRKLYPEYDHDKNKPKSQQAFASNSAAAKLAAEKLNELTGGSKYQAGALDWHPGSIQHVFESMTGGLGKFVLDVASTGKRIIDGDKFDPTQAPIVRRFIGSTSSPQADQARFYELREEAQKAGSVNTKAAQRDAGTDTAQGRAADKFLSQNERAIEGEAIFKAADKAMKPLRKEKDAIEADENMPAGDKRTELDRIKREMQAVQNEARKNYLALKKEARP